jgi:hypothetical protein
MLITTPLTPLYLVYTESPISVSLNKALSGITEAAAAGLCIWNRRAVSLALCKLLESCPARRATRSARWCFAAWQGFSCSFDAVANAYALRAWCCLQLAYRRHRHASSVASMHRSWFAGQPCGAQADTADPYSLVSAPHNQGLVTVLSTLRLMCCARACGAMLLPLVVVESVLLSATAAAALTQAHVSALLPWPLVGLGSSGACECICQLPAAAEASCWPGLWWVLRAQ